jgi:plastocyanin
MKIRLIVPAIAAGALVLAACGGGSGSGSGGTSAPVNADVVVRAIDPLSWDKAAYTAKAGDDVIAAVNDSTQPHNLHIVAPDKTDLPLALDIPSKGDEKTATVTLVPGTYTIICTIPGHTNMKATLTVT